MALVELQCEAELSQVCLQTILKALNKRGLKCYREEFKFILNADNISSRFVYCEHGRKWANTAFTDECPLTSAGHLGSRRWGGRMGRSGIRLVLGQ